MWLQRTWEYWVTGIMITEQRSILCSNEIDNNKQRRYITARNAVINDVLKGKLKAWIRRIIRWIFWKWIRRSQRCPGAPYYCNWRSWFSLRSVYNIWRKIFISNKNYAKYWSGDLTKCKQLIPNSAWGQCSLKKSVRYDASNGLLMDGA